MRRIKNMRDGAILVGVLLLLWSITSFFTDLQAAQASQSPIDQLDEHSAQVVVPVGSITPAGTLVASPALSPQPSPIAGEMPSIPLPASAGNTLATLPPVVTASASDAAASAAASAPSTPTPIGTPLVPSRIVIPAIHLDAPVIASNYRLIGVDGAMYQQWEAPNGYVAGWLASSATLGVPGNTVLAGHHNIFGEVFGHLVDLAPGETIQVYSGSTVITYEITNKMILAERGQPLSVRLDNARWLLPTTDERLTLITCWPQWTNTHRLIIVAKPVSRTIANP